MGARTLAGYDRGVRQSDTKQEETMGRKTVNGVGIEYELAGEGPPLVLVHGSWGDRTGWALVLPLLAESFTVLAYDRRGHSDSERPTSQGSVHEDADDLAALLETLGHAPAHVVTNSHGGNIAMRLAARRPELFRTLCMHEPPTLALIGDDPMASDLGAKVGGVAEKIAAGDHEDAARIFADDVALGPGTWETQLPPEFKQIMIRNAPTFLDEVRDPDGLGIDREGLAEFDAPTLLSDGDQSPAMYAKVIERLQPIFPDCERRTLQGAAHLPQLTHPAEYTEMIVDFARARSAA
jgi:pimeloyl-ACP methyl ester carboxylesterase